MIERVEVVAPEISWQMCGRAARAVVEAPRRLEHLARAREDLAGHEEGLSTSARRRNDTSRLTR